MAWFVIDAVEAMDLAGFYGAYRQDGHGRAAHEPSMMLALLMYCYAVGERPSRAQVVLGQPLPQRRRQQQLLLSITPQEVLRHRESVLTRSDDTRALRR